MIFGKKTCLRALTKNDLLKLVEWRNDPEVTKLLGGWSFPVSLDEESVWFERIREDTSTKRLAVETIDSKTYIGNVGLYAIDWKNRKAEYAILIGDRSAWGKGYGLDATQALLGFAFRQMNLHRIYLHVFSHHTNAIRLYEKAGFKIEGELRQDNFKDGRYHNTLVMGILASEYLNDASDK